MNKWVGLAAGGTGGHMFPAEALATEMKARGWGVLLLTDARGQRFTNSFPADEIVVLPAHNPAQRGLGAKFSVAATLLSATLAARSALKRVRCQVSVGFGGYPSAPGLLAAKLSGIPIGVHEQNVVLGRVNRQAALRAAFVAHGFPKLERAAQSKVPPIYVGNPAREAVHQMADAAYQAPGEDNPLNILVYGGSQGASLFSSIVTEGLIGLPDALKERLRVTQQAPVADQPVVTAAYDAAGITAEVAPFFDDLPARLASSHFVISRAGAATVTELALIGRPSLLIPLGIAMDDHQKANAALLVEAGASDLLEEKDATADAITAILSPRLGDAEGLARAAAAAKGAAKSGATTAVADLVEAHARTV